MAAKGRAKELGTGPKAARFGNSRKEILTLAADAFTKPA